MNTKECTKCHTVKASGYFYKVHGPKAPKHGLSSWCGVCMSAKAREWGRNNEDKKKINYKKWAAKDGGKYYRKNKVRLSALIRKASLKRLYGITTEQYEIMFRAQAGACAICQKQNLNGQRLCVDHDHKNGEVRALLCKSCNIGIARFNEDPQTLQTAIAYLDKFSILACEPT